MRCFPKATFSNVIVAQLPHATSFVALEPESDRYRSKRDSRLDPYDDLQ